MDIPPFFSYAWGALLFKPLKISCFQERFHHSPFLDHFGQRHQVVANTEWRREDLSLVFGA